MGITNSTTALMLSIRINSQLAGLALLALILIALSCALLNLLVFMSFMLIVSEQAYAKVNKVLPVIYLSLILD